DPVLGAHHPGRADGTQRGEELSAQHSEALAIATLEQDEDAGTTGRSLAQPLELEHRRLVVRKQLVEPCPQLQTPGELGPDPGEDEADEQALPRRAQLPRCEPQEDPLDDARLLGQCAALLGPRNTPPAGGWQTVGPGCAT